MVHNCAILSCPLHNRRNIRKGRYSLRLTDCSTSSLSTFEDFFFTRFLWINIDSNCGDKQCCTTVLGHFPLISIRRFVIDTSDQMITLPTILAWLAISKQRPYHPSLPISPRTLRCFIRLYFILTQQMAITIDRCIWLDYRRHHHRCLFFCRPNRRHQPFYLLSQTRRRNDYWTPSRSYIRFKTPTRLSWRIR